MKIEQIRDIMNKNNYQPKQDTTALSLWVWLLISQAIVSLPSLFDAYVNASPAIGGSSEVIGRGITFGIILILVNSVASMIYRMGINKRFPPLKWKEAAVSIMIVYLAPLALLLIPTFGAAAYWTAVNFAAWMLLLYKVVTSAVHRQSETKPSA